ncbi:MAG: hypothetical protein HFJ51_00460 [Clostridia bacterium]|nr:hypothetical protein [Clostridia bacterium]
MEQQKTLVELIQEMKKISTVVTERVEDFKGEKLNINTIDTLRYLATWSEALKDTLLELMIHQAVTEAAKQGGDFQEAIMKNLKNMGFDPAILSFGPRFNEDSDDE